MINIIIDTNKNELKPTKICFKFIIILLKLAQLTAVCLEEKVVIIKTMLHFLPKYCDGLSKQTKSISQIPDNLYEKSEYKLISKKAENFVMNSEFSWYELLNILPKLRNLDLSDFNNFKSIFHLFDVRN